MAGAGAAKGHAGRANGKPFGCENARALSRAAKAACAGLPRAQVLGLMAGPWFSGARLIDRTLAPSTWRQARYGPAAGRKSRHAEERGSLCGAGKRRARSEVFRRTARGKIIFAGGARRESERGREVNRRGNARGKNRNRRRRRDMGASSGGTSQNAAKTVMMDRMAARGAGPRSVLGATNAAREGEGGGRRGRGEKALQQKRIERERADRDAPCNRPLPETPHPRSL